ncbi:hypothetical protein RR48_02683 [Papilio machaon]|uniref:Uncharacterized protein n=1 Tax=Papilio machaon TaxID=76193 RepID=A0A0N0PCV8_PAPMA|nr:uncharacterized protein LOC106711880 isoform X1 [Papilio machaon]KPJ14082.1 hypothetical protein RR48_02683 [Papilio machaon]
MGLRTIDSLIIIIYSLCFCTEFILSCNVTSLEPCPGENQFCNQTTRSCECLEGFYQVGDECQTPSSYMSNHDVTAAVVSIFAIALIVCGLVLVVRKYNLIEYARQKINSQRNNDVMYEDVMIGQDDPPLSP